jgi:hypothetical protein
MSLDKILIFEYLQALIEIDKLHGHTYQILRARCFLIMALVNNDSFLYK